MFPHDCRRCRSEILYKSQENRVIVSVTIASPSASAGRKAAATASPAWSAACSGGGGDGSGRGRVQGSAYPSKGLQAGLQASLQAGLQGRRLAGAFDRSTSDALRGIIVLGGGVAGKGQPGAPGSQGQGQSPAQQRNRGSGRKQKRDGRALLAPPKRAQAMRSHALRHLRK